MQYLKRNAKFGILSFLSIILTLTNYIQIPTKTDIYYSFTKIPKKYIKKYNLLFQWLAVFAQQFFNFSSFL